MAKKKAAPEPPEGILATAAKSIGTAAGKIAAAVGMTPPSEPEAKKAATTKSAKKYKAPVVKKAKKTVKKAANKSTAVRKSR